MPPKSPKSTQKKRQQDTETTTKNPEEEKDEVKRLKKNKDKREKDDESKIQSKKKSPKKKPKSTPKKTKKPSKFHWKTEKGFLFMNHEENKGVKKIAGFSLDGTVIKTKSSKSIPINSKDWVFLNDQVAPKLKEFYDNGFKIVFFANQLNISKKKLNQTSYRTRIENVGKKLDFPVQAFIATENNHIRKPSIYMWKRFVEEANDNQEISLQDSFFVGNLAGREDDQDCSDRQFAANIGLPFKTPEEIFTNKDVKEEKFSWKSFDAKEIKQNPPKNLYEPSEAKLVSEEQEIILLIGLPVSGKTTFFKKYLEPSGYIGIHREDFTTKTKFLENIKKNVENKRKICIDTTNHTTQSRADILLIGKTFSIPVRAFRFMASRPIAEHLNWVRVIFSNGEISHVPPISFNRCKIDEPLEKEGFSQILKINFVPDLPNEKQSEIFYTWTSKN
ncbi:bifunctional polynucleotide phosphatase/kinase [Anaeramoeba ignava]|uniref:Bifunctional polynucleotide phosphatase/kinase n=1 Tax=Anaeramoeba ignava TaxID=1746090 RepID=A0A9Q0RB30_ANAIG|nr:bifunctional polynucleotide phosphatase/kinase [Anaeramoeba ignava]